MIEDFKNKIYNEDCLGLEGMCKLPDKSIDMILCDLPYGTTRNKWDSVIPLDKLWLEYERVIKDNGAIVLTAQTPFDKVLGASNLRLLRYEWIWVKSLGTGHLNAKKMPLKNHENILIFYKKLPTYNPQYWYGKPYKTTSSGKLSSNYGAYERTDTESIDGRRYPLTVQHFNSDRGLHPTQKPVELFKYLIKTYTNEGDVVLDSCMGSGTTAIACIESGRSYIGYELNKDYFNIIKERIDEKVKVNIRN